MPELLNKIQKIKDTSFSNKELSKEVLEIIQILDAIENHTAQLRTKILNEISSENNNIHLSLNKIEE